ncbi:MAG: hypothetical protein JW963_00325 [Anaerolineales bacterium]|nr:hypothetical protein [Anaerolineales bacterium]
MKRNLLLPFVILALFGLILWSPWITREAAEQRTEQALLEAWSNVADGCGIDCNGCGAIQSMRVPFGVLVTLEYGCGMLPADSPEYHERTLVFVSAFGAVYGIPKP